MGGRTGLEGMARTTDVEECTPSGHDVHLVLVVRVLSASWAGPGLAQGQPGLARTRVGRSVADVDVAVSGVGPADVVRVSSPGVVVGRPTAHG